MNDSCEIIARRKTTSFEDVRCPEVNDAIVIFYPNKLFVLSDFDNSMTRCRSRLSAWFESMSEESFGIEEGRNFLRDHALDISRLAVTISTYLSYLYAFARISRMISHADMSE